MNPSLFTINEENKFTYLKFKSAFSKILIREVF